MVWRHTILMGSNVQTRDVSPDTIEQRLGLLPTRLTVEPADSGFELVNAEGKPVSIHASMQAAMLAGDVLAAEAAQAYAANMMSSSRLDADKWVFKEGDEGPEFTTRDGMQRILCVEATENIRASYAAEDGLQGTYPGHVLGDFAYKEGFKTPIEAKVWLGFNIPEEAEAELDETPSAAAGPSFKM